MKETETEKSMIEQRGEKNMKRYKQDLLYHRERNAVFAQRRI